MFLHVLTLRIHSLMAIGSLFIPCAYLVSQGLCAIMCIPGLIPGCILFLLFAMAKIIMYN